MVNCPIRGLLCYWLQEGRLNLQALVWRTVVLDSNCMNNKKSKCTNLALCATGTSVYKTIKGLSLTQWGWDKKQRALSKAFSSMKMLEFQLKIHWTFVPMGPINNILALVQMMVWHWPGDKPLSKPMLVKIPKHICVTQPQRVKNANSHQWTSLVAIMELQEVCIKSGNLLLTYQGYPAKRALSAMPKHGG